MLCLVVQRKGKTQPLSGRGMKLAEKQHEHDQQTPDLLVVEFQLER